MPLRLSKKRGRGSRVGGIWGHSQSVPLVFKTETQIINKWRGSYDVSKVK